MTRAGWSAIALILGAVGVGGVMVLGSQRGDEGPAIDPVEAEANWARLVARAELPTTRGVPLPTPPEVNAERGAAIADAAEHGGGAFFARREEETAVEALVTWAEDHGDLGAELCDGLGIDPIATMRLARLTLATAAADPADPRYAAVAHLGSRLLRRGRILHGVVGLTVLELLLARAGLEVLPVSEWSLPLEDALPGVLAREHLCAHQALLAHGPPPELAAGFRPEAELLAYRAFFGAQVVALDDQGEDEQALLTQALLPPPEVRPLGTWVRSFPNHHHQQIIETWVRVRRAWREAVAQEPKRKTLWEARRWLTERFEGQGHFPAELPEAFAALERRETAIGLQLLDGGLALDVPYPPPPGAPTRLGTLSDPERHGAETTLHVALAEVQAVLQSPDHLSSQGRWVDTEWDGSRGWLLRGSRPFGLYRQLGLRDGDLLVALDGHPIGDPAKDREILEAGLTSGALSITYRRDRREHTLIIELDEPDPTTLGR